MSVSRVSAGFGALAVSGMSLMGLATPAFAQTAPVACSPAVREAYPPGQTAQAVSDNSPERGQLISVCVSGLDPSTAFQFGVGSITLGTGTVSSTGVAGVSFNIPTKLELGPNSIFVKGTANGAPKTVTIPINIQGSNASSTPGGLPRTGSDEIVPLTAIGMSLVATGAGLVVVARRRGRETGSALAV